MDGQQSASRPAANVDLGLLATQLKLLLDNPDAAAQDDSQRLQVKQLARAASVALEQPFETATRLGFTPLQLVTAKIGQEHGIFATLAAADGPVSLAALGESSGLESGIVEAIVDYLCAQGMARYVGSEKYAATRLSRVMTTPLLRDSVTHHHDNCLLGYAALNAALGDARATLTAFQVGHGSDEDFYTWLESRPVQQGAFHGFMESQFANLPCWLDVVDFASEMGQGLGDADVAFVDVGGGNGQQCGKLRETLPGLRGRVILQDRPEIVAKALPVAGMETMGYDFLTEQPVKGARVYYFRQVMHNHDDETCIRILQAQTPALGPDSVIVVDEKALPDEKPPQGSTALEYVSGLKITMKAMLGGRERRQAHWRQLFARAGLVVRGVRMFGRFDDAAIIAAKEACM